MLRFWGVFLGDNLSGLVYFCVFRNGLVSKSSFSKFFYFMLRFWDFFFFFGSIQSGLFNFAFMNMCCSQDLFFLSKLA